MSLSRVGHRGNQANDRFLLLDNPLQIPDYGRSDMLSTFDGDDDFLRGLVLILQGKDKPVNAGAERLHTTQNKWFFRLFRGAKAVP